MKVSHTSFVLNCLILIVLTSCGSIFDQDNTQKSDIILGKSISKVELSDDSTIVIKKLGKPHEIAIGDYSGYFFHYTQGRYNGVQIKIHEENGVQSMTVKSPYDGITDTGIGIGTKKKTVVQSLGTAEFVQDELHAETYQFNGVYFTIVYDDTDRINAITMRSGGTR